MGKNYPDFSKGSLHIYLTYHSKNKKSWKVGFRKKYEPLVICILDKSGYNIRDEDDVGINNMQLPAVFMSVCPSGRQTVSFESFKYTQEGALTME